MKIRLDSVFISSILHTIALLFFIRPARLYYFAASDRAALSRFDPSTQAALIADHYLGVACLALILIGLIVVWTGYVRRSRAAWFVVFVIAWFWAFPVFVRPVVERLVHGEFMLTFSEFFYHVISGSGMTTQVLRFIVMFLLMVIALALPMGRFFIARKANEPVRLPSRRLAVSLLIGVPVAALAFYCWLSVGVLYEIPPAHLNVFLVAPPPPPPPPTNASKCADGN